jgi:hypothetical protein
MINSAQKLRFDPVHYIYCLGSFDFDSLTYYHALKMSPVNANETSTYSVVANDSASLLLRLNSTCSGVTAQGLADCLENGTESDCYTVKASGAAELASIAMTVDGVALNFK